MRYADSGGLTAEGRTGREAVRWRAAGLFEQGMSSTMVARQLRVSPQAVRGWRRAWKAGGTEALASKGPGGARCRLDDEQLAELGRQLDRGPAAHGWAEDQRWTLSRVAELIVRLFGVHYTDRGVGYLLDRMGFTPQVPVHRAVERDEQAIATWRREVWPEIKRDAAARGAWICFEDEAGQGRKPPKVRTWARRGQTPVVSVSGSGSGRVSMAGLVVAKPGERTRLFYRMVVYRRRKGEPKGLSERNYAQLLRAAHQQLRAPIVLVWDNLNTHTSRAMRKFIDVNDWLTVYQLPTHAPELNWTEGVWSNVKGSLGNLTARSIDQLAVTVKSLLKRIQYRPGLIDGFIAETGLVIQPP